MQVFNRNEIPAYDAPRHFGMAGYRMHGGDANPFPVNVGLSVFEAGGGAEASASAVDRVYVVLHGEITVDAEGHTHVLKELDSCYIPAGQTRAILNSSRFPATLLTIIAT